MSANKDSNDSEEYEPRSSEFSGYEGDNNCHICGRELDNFTPRKGEIVSFSGGKYGNDTIVDFQKGIGTCPEHGVSYSWISMKRPERGNCHCEKDDCPVCSGDWE